MKGGGHASQIYAIRQAIAKALVAYYAKYIDAYSAMELKKKLVAYDRTLLIADPRRMEPKKFGGQGARARRQKRYAFYFSAISYSYILCLVTVELLLYFRRCVFCSTFSMWHYEYEHFTWHISILSSDDDIDSHKETLCVTPVSPTVTQSDIAPRLL